ncbi:hypothetical protein [Nocardioides conyzicola]|uniref:DUF3040 domain-containing protein n=1 Tax=Nocardioides conyzicola TaxID=1651781 RepID=A0ABP8Y0I0_9ACTN
MLNDWELRQLAGIEEELSSDKHLGRVLSSSTGIGLACSRVRRHFYPAGFLAGAVAYMGLVMGDAQRGTVGWAVLVLLLVWIFLEVRATGLRGFLLRAMQGASSSYRRE